MWFNKHWSLIEAIILSLIVVLGGWLRFRQLEVPAVYMFDEVYHVPTMKLMAHGSAWAYEWWHGELENEQSGSYVDWLHPPLAKLFGAASMTIFGENSWAWRAPSALAGTLLILAIFGLARASFPTRKYAGLIAAGLAAVDGLAIAQSRIAMNDIWVTLFIAVSVGAYYVYLKRETTGWFWLTALSAGAACACKWSGFTLWLFFAVYELYLLGKKRRQWKQSLTFLIIIGLTSICIYLASYAQMFTQHDWGHFFELHNQIFRYQFGLEATHPFAAKAWWWPLGEKPVYFYVNDDGTGQIWNRPLYATWYAGLLCLLVAVWQTVTNLIEQWRQGLRREKQKKVKERATARKVGRLKMKGEPPPSKNSEEQESFIFLLLAYFCLWLPWCFSPRIMFLHHYLPALTFVWVIAGGVLAGFRVRK